MKFGSFSWSQVGFVVPCFNDGESLIHVLKTLPIPAHKIIVDDGSNIPFSHFLRDSNGMGPIHLIEHKINLGQGASLETGFEYVRRNGILPLKYIVTFDADGQHTVQDAIEMVLFSIEKNLEVVLGSRFLVKTKGKRFEGGILKLFILRASALIARSTIKIKVSDRHNGLRVLSFETLKKITISQNGYGHADEILREIRRHNLNFAEFQVDIKYPKFERKRGQALYNGFNIVFKRFFGAK
jgi:glycosyltransferase involved in cell wall biosynthesis